jgi:hypothetical protein
MEPFKLPQQKQAAKVPCFSPLSGLYPVSMNRMDPILPAQREAKLRYLDHECEVVKPGDFVRCGVTGDPIRLEVLRYWSVDRQIPFKSAAVSFEAYLKLSQS